MYLVAYIKYYLKDANCQYECSGKSRKGLLDADHIGGHDNTERQTL